MTVSSLQLVEMKLFGCDETGGEAMWSFLLFIRNSGLFCLIHKGVDILILDLRIINIQSTESRLFLVQDFCMTLISYSNGIMLALSNSENQATEVPKYG